MDRGSVISHHMEVPPERLLALVQGVRLASLDLRNEFRSQCRLSQILPQSVCSTINPSLTMLSGDYVLTFAILCHWLMMLVIIYSD